MGLHTDAVAMSEICGKKVQECKRALKAKGDEARNKTPQEMVNICFGASKAPPPAKPATKPKAPPSEKLKKKKAPPPPPPAKTVKTEDADSIGTSIDDKGD